MLEPETEKFMGSLLDAYDPDSAPRQRIVSGSYIQLLTQAREATTQQWQDQFGAELPETIAAQDYVVSPYEQTQISQNVKQLVASTDPDIRSKLYALGILQAKDSRLAFQNIAARIRKGVYKTIVNYTSCCPEMSLTTNVETLPAINSEHSRYSTSLDCILSIFGMNAIQLLGDGDITEDNFDTHTARKMLEKSTKIPQRAIFDLSFMLGLLSTKYIEEFTGNRIRVCLVAGADFGEIEQKIITPVQIKDPSVKFIINTLIASDYNTRANHAVSIIGATGDAVHVQDPKFSSAQKVPAETFWNRWITANLQAVVIVAQPKD